MSGTRRRDPKGRIRRCEASGCNEVATLQVLGALDIGLHVFNVCAKHYKEKHDSMLEETYLRSFQRLGKFGVRTLDDFFEKKTARMIPETRRAK